MSSTENRVLLAAAASLVSLCWARPASAQCDAPNQGFQSISVEPANSFQAEYAYTGLLHNFAGPTAGTRPLSVARDSKGRVRTDSSAGKYNTKSPDGQQSEVERHIIWICDPVTQNSIRLDTVDKTATIQAPRLLLERLTHLPPSSARPVIDPQLPFCSRSFAVRKSMSMVRTQDLGHQVFAGFDVVGQREWHVPRELGRPESNPPTTSKPPATSEPPTAPANYREWWCSDDLGAMLQRIDVVSSPRAGTHRSELNLQNIQRAEPDPSLFQVPPDYTVVERLRERKPGQLLRLPTPNNPR